MTVTSDFQQIEELKTENQQLREQVACLEERIAELEDTNSKQEDDGLINQVTVRELVEAIDHIRSLAEDIRDVAKAALDEV